MDYISCTYVGSTIVIYIIPTGLHETVLMFQHIVAFILPKLLLQSIQFFIVIWSQTANIPNLRYAFTSQNPALHSPFIIITLTLIQITKYHPIVSEWNIRALFPK